MAKKIDSEEELAFLVPYLKALVPQFDNNAANVPHIRTALREVFLINLTRFKHKVVSDFIKRHLDEYGASNVDSPREEVNAKQKAVLKTFKRWDRQLEKPPLSEGQAPKKPKRSPINAMTTTPVGLSVQLQSFLGIQQATRTEIVKLIWVYIREHNLQNPKDGREIICDDKMRIIFGDNVTMFDMNKKLLPHIIKLPSQTSGEAKDVSKDDKSYVSQTTDNVTDSDHSSVLKNGSNVTSLEEDSNSESDDASQTDVSTDSESMDGESSINDSPPRSDDVKNNISGTSASESGSPNKREHVDNENNQDSLIDNSLRGSPGVADRSDSSVGNQSNSSESESEYFSTNDLIE